MTVDIVRLTPDKPGLLARVADDVGVTPSHRRQGIGRRLLAQMMALGRGLGCAECWVGTEVDNQPARELYARHAKAGIFALYEFDL